MIGALAAAAVATVAGSAVLAGALSRNRDEVLRTVADDPALPRMELNGRLFHVDIHGEEDNPVIVVLHGGPGGDHRSLLALADLADAHRVVFWDQRGAGLSERVPAEELTAATALGDLDAIVGRVSPDDPVVLVGHSWGATLAAGYMRHRPGRVRAAVLAEPGYLDHQEYLSWKERYDELMSGWAYMRVAIAAGFAAQRISGPDEHAAGDYLVGQRILPAFLDHPGNPYHLPGRRYGAPSWRWGRVAGEALAGETFDHETLDRVDGEQANGDTPVLFLASEHNSWIGESLQRRHAEASPGAGLAVIADSGHDMFWDNPDETLEAVRRFLSGGVDAVGSGRLAG